MLSRHSEPQPLAEAHEIAARNLQSGGLIAAYRGWAHNILARVLLRRGQLEQAEAEAEQGRAILVIAPMWQLESLEMLIRIRLRQGRTGAARELATVVAAQLQAVGSAGHIEVAVRLAGAEALHAAGELVAAEQALRETLALIDQRAASIPDPTARQRFFEQVPENAEARALARRWLETSLPSA
jgi:ATP/maltotriose-dependent transcriptional regulator MalT